MRLVWAEPKTSRSRRSVPLQSRTLNILAAWREVQRAELSAIGLIQDDDTPVFTNINGEPFPPMLVLGRFRRLAAEAGLPAIRVHDLRHSFATNALHANIPAKVVSDILGHSTVAFTLDVYAHAVPSMQEDAIELLAELTWGLQVEDGYDTDDDQDKGADGLDDESFFDDAENPDEDDEDDGPGVLVRAPS